MNLFEWLTFDLQLFDTATTTAGAGGSSASSQQQAGADNDDDEDDEKDEGGSGDDRSQERTFTQQELNKIIEKRLRRERKEWERKLEEERRRAQMSESEKLKAEKEEAEQRAKEATERANQRIIRSEAKAIAAEIGVNPKRLDYAVKLADLAEVEVGEDGEPDRDAIREALEKVLKDFPELKGGSAEQTVGKPSNPVGGAGGPRMTMNDFIRAQAGKLSIRR